MILNNKLEGMVKEAAGARSNALIRHIPGRNDGNQKT
jgi:hypothetical protein